MERVTISMSDEFAAELATFMADHRYANRSEAVRDLTRLGLNRMSLDGSTAGQCMATLSYVFDHHRRDLAQRLTEAHHAHHDLQVATMHVHLDHESCLEVAVLRGDAAAVRDLARGVVAETGVKFGQVSFLPVTLESAAHSHGPGEPVHRHLHARPMP